MPAGVINPNGRHHLNETSRIIKRPFYGEFDKQLFRKKVVSNESTKPFFKIKSKAEREQIKSEILRLFRQENLKKSSILTMLINKLNFNKIEAENIFFDSMKKRIRVKHKNSRK